MATITGSVAGGDANTNGAWLGGVQPGSGDDVLLTASSGNINIPSGVTLSCRSIDCTGFTGSLTFAATSSTLTIGDASGGKATFVSGMSVVLTAIGTINFVATTASTTYALTTGGRVMPNLTVNTGSTTTIQFADAVTATGATLTLTAGKLDTNGQTVVAGSAALSNSNTRTITLGSSGVTLTATGTAWSMGTTTNLTITSNSATVTLSGASGGITSGSSTNFNGMSFVASGSGTFGFNGGGTVANFTRTGTAVKTDVVQFQNNLTCTSTFTANGNSITNRLLVQSNTLGTARTITAATVTITNADLADITGAGAGSWDLSAITGLSGDCGGNTGITFTTGITTFKVASGTFDSTARWASSTGGVGGTGRIPLPQDVVRLDGNSGAGTHTPDASGRYGELSVTNGFSGTLSFANAVSWFGSWTLGTGMTVSGTGTQTLAGRAANTITTAGQTVTALISVAAVTGSYTLQDAFTDNRASALSIVSGSFNDGGQSISLTNTSGSISVASTATSVTLSGSTTLSATGGTPWSFSGSVALTHTGTITLSAASASTRTFSSGGRTYNILTYTVAGSTGQLTISGAPTFAAINFSDATNARTLVLPSSTTTTVTTFNVNGTAGALMTVKSSTGGTAATLVLGAPTTMVYVAMQDITATPSNAVYVLDGTSTSGNTGVVFEPNNAQHPSLRNAQLAALASAVGANAAAQRAAVM